MLKYHIKEKKPKKTWKCDCRWRLTNIASQTTIQPIKLRTTIILCECLNGKISIICTHTRRMEFPRSFSLWLPRQFMKSFYVVFDFHFHNASATALLVHFNSIPLHQWMQHLCTDDGHTSKPTRSIYIVISQTIAFLLSNVPMYCVSVYQWRHCCCCCFCCCLYAYIVDKRGERKKRTQRII